MQCFEFLLILPGLDAQAATARLEALRTQLSQVGQPTRIGTLPVTLSAGIAIWPAHGQGLDSLLQAADVALYRAKRDGRNRVEVALPPAEANRAR